MASEKVGRCVCVYVCVSVFIVTVFNFACKFVCFCYFYFWYKNADDKCELLRVGWSEIISLPIFVISIEFLRNNINIFILVTTPVKSTLKGIFNCLGFNSHNILLLGILT